MTKTQRKYVFAASVIFTVSVLTIFGWLFHVVYLIRWVNGFSPMQFTTALGFSFLAIGFLGWGVKSRTLAMLGGGLAILLGLLSLFSTAFNVNQLFVDHLVEPWFVEATRPPGRMAPGSAVGFVMSGLGLVYPFGFYMQTFVCGATVSSLIISLGYIMVVDVSATQMAFNSMFCFLFAGYAHLIRAREVLHAMTSALVRKI